MTQLCVRGILLNTRQIGAKFMHCKSSDRHICRNCLRKERTLVVFRSTASPRYLTSCPVIILPRKVSQHDDWSVQSVVPWAGNRPASCKVPTNGTALPLEGTWKGKPSRLYSPLIYGEPVEVPRQLPGRLDCSAINVVCTLSGEICVSCWIIVQALR